ncbi:MAG: hypothetical protein ACK52I_20695 [Pseudomonadota bacterium]|jgi:hypothetical protein
MSSRTGEEDAELSAALGWPGGISEPLLDRVALLRLVASATVELASMRRCFEAADRERSELRERAAEMRTALRIAREGYTSEAATGQPVLPQWRERTVALIDAGLKA